MNKIKQSILAIVIGLGLAAGVSFAWTGAPADPPNLNVPAPINVGSTRQDFIGSKTLGFSNGIGILTILGGLKIQDGSQGMGKVLTSDADGDASWQNSSGIPSNFKVHTSSGLFTVPTGVSKIMVEVWGGGGGGGGGGNGTKKGGGGGGGGYSKGIYAVNSGQSYTVNIGNGGQGGAPVSDGSDGGDSNFTSTSGSLNASGGKHGVFGGSGSSGFGGAGGNGASSGNNIFGIKGGYGVDGAGLNSPGGGGGNAGGGGGAGGMAGIGGSGWGHGYNGFQGEIPGGGGGGGDAANNNSNITPGSGGAGAQGRIIVYW